MNTIPNSTEKIQLGVLGEHLPHTLSPEIHFDLLKQQHISADFKVYEMSKTEVHHVLDVMREKNIIGMNVTIPYKETVYRMMDVLDPHAAEIGAVNTIYQKDGKFYGYNTDYIGVLSMFEKAGISLKGLDTVILGSGGAAKALIYAFHLAKASSITIAARNEKGTLPSPGNVPLYFYLQFQGYPGRGCDHQYHSYRDVPKCRGKRSRCFCHPPLQDCVRHCLQSADDRIFTNRRILWASDRHRTDDAGRSGHRLGGNLVSQDTGL